MGVAKGAAARTQKGRAWHAQLPELRLRAAFFGTFLPFLRASESPMAMACLRLLAAPPLPPLPRFSVPFFLRCIARLTSLPALLGYFLAILLSPLSRAFER